MRRRDVVLGGLVGTAAAALPVKAAAAPRSFEVKLVRMRFKPDGKRVWLDWAEELQRRREEVVATLRNEGVRSEACFLAKDGETLFYFMESIDSAKVRSAFGNSKLAIDAEHRVKLNSLEFVEAMTPLFGFQNDIFPDG